MADKKSFVLYLDNEKQVNMLTDEQAGKLFKALFRFAKTGEETDFDDLGMQMIFSFMADSIKRDSEKYIAKCEKNRQIALNREKRKREQKDTNVHERAEAFTKSTDNDNVNDNVNDNDNVNVTDNENDNENDNVTDNENDIENENENEKISATNNQQNKSEMSIQDFLNLYNNICKSLPSIRKLSTHSQQNVEKILASYSIDEIRETLEKAEKSLFLQGKKNNPKGNYKNWKASFTWITEEEHFANIINGKYDNSPEDDNFQEDYEIFMNWY